MILLRVLIVQQRRAFTMGAQSSDLYDYMHTVCPAEGGVAQVKHVSVCAERCH
jgi:hypothetical protein